MGFNWNDTSYRARVRIKTVIVNILETYIKPESIECKQLKSEASQIVTVMKRNSVLVSVLRVWKAGGGLNRFSE